MHDPSLSQRRERLGSLVEELLKAAGVGGWTIIRDVAGMGHSGFHQGKTIFNDQSGLVMFVGVAEEKVIADVARGLARLFASGITFGGRWITKARSWRAMSRKIATRPRLWRS